MVGGSAGVFTRTRGRQISVAVMGGEQRCEERLSGSIIQKVTVSSDATTAPTSSYITPQSPAMAIALCRKEMRSNLKSSRVQKGLRRPTCKRQASSSAIISAGWDSPSAGLFYFPGASDHWTRLSPSVIHGFLAL